MPVPELPEADVPDVGTPLPRDAEPEMSPEAISDESAVPIDAALEPETPNEPVEADVPASTQETLRDDMPGGVEESMESVPVAEPVSATENQEVSAAVASAEATPSAEVALPAQRPQLSVVAAGLLLIGLGIMLIWPALSGGFILVPGLIVLITTLGLTLTLLAYWRDNARRARGALFMSLLCLTWGLLTSMLLLTPELGGLAHLGPFYAVTLGITALLTALGDRPIESRLVSAGLVAIAAGGATVAVTWDLIQADLLTAARQVGPWLLVILAVGLLPLAIRRGRPSGSSGTSS